MSSSFVLFVFMRDLHIKTHRTILLYMIVWFYVNIKNNIMTFLGLFLSNFTGRGKLSDILRKSAGVNGGIAVCACAHGLVDGLADGQAAAVALGAAYFAGVVIFRIVEYGINRGI